jgi:hypothetical protein
MDIKIIDYWSENRDVVVHDIGDVLDVPMLRELFKAAAKDDDVPYSMYHLLRDIDKTVNDLKSGDWFRVAFVIANGGIHRSCILKHLLRGGLEYNNAYIYEALHTQEGNLVQRLYACDGEVLKLYLDTFFDDDGNQKAMTEDEIKKADECFCEQIKKEN